MLVRPITMKPARRSRATTGASASAGAESSSAREPARVTCPLMSNRSLIETGNAGERRRRRLDLAQPVHRLGSLDRGFRIDMNEGARALAGGVGDPGQAFVDELAGAGAASFEIVGQCGKGRSSSAWLYRLVAA